MNEVISPVLITCPETGEAVATVFRLRPSAFEMLRGEYSFRCARCGKVHAWRKEEAWLKHPPTVAAAAGGDSDA